MATAQADWFEGAGAGGQLDVAKLLDSKAGDALHALIATGALISCGLTSDGGALGITVTVDGRYRREYFREEEAIIAWAAEAIPAATAARAASSPAAGNGRGARRR